MFTAYSKFWKQYFDFKSRSKRSDFWWPFLINSVISFAFYIIILVAVLVPYFERTAELANVGLASEGTSPWSNVTPAVVVTMVLWGLFSLAILVPTLAIGVRRLRDAAFHWALIFIYGASLLLAAIPLLNIFSALLFIASIVLWAFPSREKVVKPSVIVQPVMAPQPQFQPAQPQMVQPQQAMPQPNTVIAPNQVAPAASQPGVVPAQPLQQPVQPTMPQQPVAPAQPGMQVPPQQPANPNPFAQQPNNGQ